MKKCKFACITLLLFMMLTGSVLTVSAQGSVTYDCGSHVFILEPGSKESPTDLFPEFKDVIPGETLTQDIVIRNAEKSNMISKIYLRSLGASEKSEEFLSQLPLKITLGETQGIFQGPADETVQLSDWVCLGELYPGSSITLHLTLEIPVTLDNKFQEAVGRLKWEFKAEEIDIPEDEFTNADTSESETGTVTNVKTGDNLHFARYIVLFLVSSMILFSSKQYFSKKRGK